MSGGAVQAVNPVGGALSPLGAPFMESIGAKKPKTSARAKEARKDAEEVRKRADKQARAEAQLTKDRRRRRAAGTGRRLLTFTETQGTADTLGGATA